MLVLADATVNSDESVALSANALSALDSETLHLSCNRLVLGPDASATTLTGGTDVQLEPPCLLAGHYCPT